MLMASSRCGVRLSSGSKERGGEGVELTVPPSRSLPPDDDDLSNIRNRLRHQSEPTVFICRHRRDAWLTVSRVCLMVRPSSEHVGPRTLIRSLSRPLLSMTRTASAKARRALCNSPLSMSSYSSAYSPPSTYSRALPLFEAADLILQSADGVYFAVSSLQHASAPSSLDRVRRPSRHPRTGQPGAQGRSPARQGGRAVD